MNALPKEISDYLDTTAGRIMVEGMTWFRWNVQQKRVTSSGNGTRSLSPENRSIPGSMMFKRTASGWERAD